MNIKNTSTSVWRNHRHKVLFLFLTSIILSTFFWRQNDHALIANCSLVNVYNTSQAFLNKLSNASSGLWQAAPKPDKEQFWLLEARETFLSEIWVSAATKRNGENPEEQEYQKWEKNMIVLKNDDDLLPIQNIEKHIHIFDLTRFDTKPLRQSIGNYNTNITFQKLDIGFHRPLRITEENQISVFLFDANTYNAIPENINDFLHENKQTILIQFGEPSNFSNHTMAQSVIYVTSQSEKQLTMLGQMLFGGIRGSGKIPAYLIDTVLFKNGIETTKTRLGHKLPQDSQRNQRLYSTIDSIMQDAIAKGAFPGGQVFVAHKGMIVFDESFGYHDYTEQRKTKSTDLYDIASITKIAATTLATMKLTEQKKIDLDLPLKHFFKDTIAVGYNDAFAEATTDSLSSLTDLRIEEIEKTDYLNNMLVSDSLNSKRKPTETFSGKSIFNVPLRKLMVHQSGINPSLPILPYYLYEQTYSQILQDENKDLFADQGENYPVQNTGADAPGNISQKKLVENDDDSLKSIFSFDREQAFEHFFSDKKADGVAVLKVAENMFLKEQFRDSLFNEIKKMKVRNDTVYQYSCTNMIMMQMVIDSMVNEGFEEYLKKEFYRSLGMHRTTYNPLNYFEKEEIAPTENDEIWRGQLLQGTVHDPSAAIMGGVSGNAGLFSTAADLGILGQMLLNGGHYGGKQYLDTATVRQFTRKQEENYRGLGFDRPSPNGVHAADIHPASFGHLGFTGTAMWVDPENEIVFVFLSNRVYPTANNNLIATEKIRQKVHQAVYDAFIEKDNHAVSQEMRQKPMLNGTF